MTFSADEFFVSRARHVPDELQLLSSTLCNIGDASGFTLERRQETIALVGSTILNYLKIL
jgi:hypothetical protein